MTGSIAELAKLFTQDNLDHTISDRVTKMFDRDGEGNLVQEASIFDHMNNGQIPPCPVCIKGSAKYYGTVMKFKKVKEDKVDGELMGTHYECQKCHTKLLVIND